MIQWSNLEAYLVLWQPERYVNYIGKKKKKGIQNHTLSPQFYIHAIWHYLNKLEKERNFFKLKVGI